GPHRGYCHDELHPRGERQVSYTLSDHFYDLTRQHEADMDANARFEEAADRAGCKLYDELSRIRRLPTPAGRQKAMMDLVAELLAEEGGVEEFDRFIERLAQDVDPEPTALVMRWAGETEYLP